MNHGCNIAAQFYSELGWAPIDFHAHPRYPFRLIARWHVINTTDDMELHHQIGTFHDAFAEINYHLSKLGKQLVPTADPEKADIKISFHTGTDHPIKKFPKGVLAYALPGHVYVNDNYYWSLLKKMNTKSLKYTLIHEILHILGVGHTKAEGDIMEPEYNPDNTITKDTLKVLHKRYDEAIEWQELKQVNSVKRAIKLFAITILLITIMAFVLMILIYK